MTPYVALAVLLALIIACTRWKNREQRPSWTHRLPGGPDDGKGCLTHGDRETFAALVADLERKDAP